jgi:hypothetical protein
LGASGRLRGSLPEGLALHQPQQFVDLVFGQRIGFDMNKTFLPIETLARIADPVMLKGPFTSWNKSGHPRFTVLSVIPAPHSMNPKRSSGWQHA